MIPIAICDDELLHARQTQAAIRRCEAQAVTRCFETPLALLAAVTKQGYARAWPCWISAWRAWTASSWQKAQCARSRLRRHFSNGLSLLCAGCL